MKNRFLLAAAMLFAFLPVAAQQTMGPIVVKGNVTATGSVFAGGTGTTNQACTQANGLCGGSASGSVTSVGLSLPSSMFTVSGSPVTSSGTLSAAFASQAANCFFASPNGSTGVPSCRAIAAQDIPTLNQNTSGTAANLSGTPTLPNGTSATTQATGDSSAALATDAFVQNVKATIPTTTTINSVACSLGGSCAVTNYCAGASCPQGSQVNVPFTTTGVVTIPGSFATSDTSFTMTSTAGFPSLGCGQLYNNGGQSEILCWQTSDSTHFYGLTRAYNGSVARSGTSGYIKGFINSLSSSSTTAPTWFQTNDGLITYVQPASFGSLYSQSISAAQLASTSVQAIPNGNAFNGSNVNSGGLATVGSAWNGSSAINDTWGWNTILASGTNPATTYTLSHSGSSGAATISMPFPVKSVAAAPTGSCLVNGTWVMSQDGAITWCNNGTWTTFSAGVSSNTTPSVISQQFTNLSASQASTNLQCVTNGTPGSCAAGMYRATILLTSTGGGSGSVTGTLGWSDGGTAPYSYSTQSLPIGPSTSQATGAVSFYITAGTNITFSTSYSGSGSYSARVVIERLQ